MKNSGYVAIGHLIGGKSKEEIVKTLKHFISVMFKALDDNMINKVDFEWNLDKFMEKMPKDTPITLQVVMKSGSKSRVQVPHFGFGSISTPHK